MDTTAIPDARVRITKRGGANPIDLSVSGLICSWEVNRAGQLSCFATAEQLSDAGLGNTRIVGRWIDYEHPTAGRWAGVIVLSNPTDGIYEIAGQSFHVLTQKRLVDISKKKDEPFIGTPGAILRMAFQQINNSSPLFITLGTVEDTNDQIEVTWTGADFYGEVIPQLTDDVKQEWTVTNDRVLHYRKRIGEDKTATVRLVEGRSLVVGTSYPEDIFTTVNSIRAIGFGRIKKKTKKGKTLSAEFDIGPITVRNNTSVDLLGELQELRDYGYVGTKEELERRAAADVADSDYPFAAPTLQVADVDGAFASFREGDSVTVELGLSGIRAEVRVMIRSLDVSTGVMTVSGIGERV